MISRHIEQRPQITTFMSFCILNHAAISLSGNIRWNRTVALLLARASKLPVQYNTL